MSNIDLNEEDFQLKKAKLECRKLEVEIDNAVLVWWKKPAYLAGAAPIFIALVGFISVIMSGYFDGRKLRLEANIKNLQTQEDILQSKVDGMQKSIDRAYMNLILAGSNLSYANDHHKVCGPSLTQLERTNLAERNPSKKLIERLAGCMSNSQLIREISADIIEEFNEHLSKVPASSWVKVLRANGPIAVLSAPDGRVYDPKLEQYFDSMDQYHKANSRKQ